MYFDFSNDEGAMATISGRIEGLTLTVMFTGNCQFPDTEFDDVNLMEVKFANVNLRSANFSNADMTKMTVDNVNLSGTRITNSTIDGLTIDGIPVAEALRLYRAAQDATLPSGRD